jgi:hypothetical protein
MPGLAAMRFVRLASLVDQGLGTNGYPKVGGSASHYELIAIAGHGLALIHFPLAFPHKSADGSLSYR